MAEYNISFSERLLEAARFVAEEKNDSEEADRTVLYLSCLACEITLKALLELAGKPITEIKKLNHNLSSMLLELGNCYVQIPIVKDFITQVSAIRIRSVVVDEKYTDATVGNILSAEKEDVSRYPNAIRYGDMIKHYPASMVLDAAIKVTDWAKEHRRTISIS